MARVTVWLFIESTDLDADQMSTRIGVPPDKSWRKGDPRGKTGKVFGLHSWKLESRVEVDEDPLAIGATVQTCLRDVLGRIIDHADRFRILALGQKSAGLYIGISAKEAPALDLKAETIGIISTLGVDLELDLMV
jgi:uncharacterized protein DUF4279